MATYGDVITMEHGTVVSINDADNVGTNPYWCYGLGVAVCVGM